ncbi:chloride channel protein [bacterium]|nr:chloride channel protein [bacterium]
MKWTLNTPLPRVFPLGSKRMIVAAVLAGAAVGLANIAFRELIDLIQRLSFGVGTGINLAEAGVPWWRILILPAIGAVVAAPLLIYGAREARGHGVPPVLEALAVNGGRLRGRLSLIKLLASSICIGSGGSAGREGPIIQIGAAIASTIGQKIRFSREQLRTIVAAGAAAGISTTFNAPIAGVIFAVEVLLVRSSLNLFPILIASVTGAVAGRAYFGDHPAFEIPVHHFIKSIYDFGFYFLLGGGCGVLSFAFIRAMDALEQFFTRRDWSDYAKMGLGGLAVGALGILFPQVLGSNYHAVEAALTLKADFTLNAFLLLLALAFVKIFATSCTLGSGSSGGVFAPTLFWGSSFGAAFGLLAHRLVPNVTPDAGAYALVGMAAAVAGCLRAPMTAVIIIFEMTDSYQIILPLMTAVSTSLLVSYRLEPHSLYTLPLARKGLSPYLSADGERLAAMTVREAMLTDPPKIHDQTPLPEVLELMRDKNLNDLPVVDPAGDFMGMVSLDDIREILLDREFIHNLVASDVRRRAEIHATPDMSLFDALVRLESQPLHVLPVLSGTDRKTCVGILRSDDVLVAYEREILREMH